MIQHEVVSLYSESILVYTYVAMERGERERVRSKVDEDEQQNFSNGERERLVWKNT